MGKYGDGAPNIYDRKTFFEAYASEPGIVRILVPDFIDATPDQAEAYGNALIALAKWSREQK